MSSQFPTEVLRVRDREAREILLPHLIGNVFHVTRHSALEKIVESGMIDPTARGALGNSFPQSANSYGRHKGFVCLFDFRAKTHEAIAWGLDCCSFLNSRTLGDHLAIVLIRAEATISLIPPSVAFAETGGAKVWIPEVECWYPGPVPLHAIERVLDVHVERSPIPKGSLLNAILAASDEMGQQSDG